MVIKRVSPLSCAKIAGLLYVVIGLIIGAMFSLIGIAGFAAAPAQDESAVFGALFGVGAIILFPIMYGCLGFIGAALMAWLYNLVAGAVGGVQVEVE